MAATVGGMIYELRRYTLHPGARDTLIELFDREFVTSQQERGIRVVGQFRELDDPDRFTWIRAFPDMESRLRSLTEFYSGPVWQQHRDAANATMIDSDDVLLLRPIGQEITEGADASPDALITATICLLTAPLTAESERTVTDRVQPLLAAAGAEPFALFTTEYSENTFPALPVRTGEHALVWLTRFENAGEHETVSTRLAAMAPWRAALDELGLLGDPMELRLTPTDRSLLR
ncbi:quinol monooxygenase YgiN [Allocatelliglobosispora scoriae]|uniref:Quinol monooxygenase YgiN n=1 Tax=Allocatelliglobosispora scoriae TaxID=643052 RepID=A0A841BYA5_9ACTN|nr:NIPSNAP family protein [Allocatelliglobosispora scoriae]MBB5872458.1 quinol monooxygenase YgiN [Allocatelliglobosispora scoriae]